MILKIDRSKAKNIWLHSQKLDIANFFGSGAPAVAKAIEHLGYVQIDTINVIERCHHHILYNRIPQYKRQHLREAQTADKSVFEYWTHALSYVATSDYKYFVTHMKNTNTNKNSWFRTVTPADYKKVKSLLVKTGPISIRDIKDDTPIEKTHAWGSIKPSKKALQLGFYKGDFVVSERQGMLKKYDLTRRHFGWSTKPKTITKNEYTNYIIDRALKAQGIVSLDSICYLDFQQKKSVAGLIELRIREKKLVEVAIAGADKIRHWARPETIERKYNLSKLTHILSPFDPLIIQRKRLQLFFDYSHVFEAYVPKEKRKLGYFALPVLIENRIAALLDLKTDRLNKKIIINNWVWLEKNKSQENKMRIEKELHRFEKFQLA